MLFILFTLDSERYVIDTRQVGDTEVPLTPQSPPKTIPGASSWVAGVCSITKARRCR